MKTNNQGKFMHRCPVHGGREEYRLENPTDVEMARDLEREYGVDITTAEGVRAFDRLVRVKGPRRIPNAGVYVQICRDMAGNTLADGRLIAVGFGHVPPGEWIGHGLYEFWGYWNKAVKKPAVIGSPDNLTPEEVYRAFLMRIPPEQIKAVGLVALPRSTHSKIPGRARREDIADMARAAGRSSIPKEGYWTKEGLFRPGLSSYGADALRALGKLDPELQEAALPDLTPEPPQEKIRARDLRWDRVVELQRAFAADPSGGLRVQKILSRPGKENRPFPKRAVDMAKRAGMLGDLFEDHERVHRTLELSTWIAPAYPRVSLEQAKSISLGMSPAELSEGQLTRQEAHRWLLEAPDEYPLEWLSRQLPEGLPRIRSLSVVRWLLELQRRGVWSQLTRTRQQHLPGGQTGEYRFIDRIDEIMDEDLPRGIRTTVEDAFESASMRCSSKYMDEMERNHRVLAPDPRWSIDPDTMSWLVTPAALVQEGKEMGHCVGTYVHAVKTGQSAILALKVPDPYGRILRSTVEISPQDGQVRQHFGPGNRSPEEASQKALWKWLASSGLRSGNEHFSPYQGRWTYEKYREMVLGPRKVPSSGDLGAWLRQAEEEAWQEEGDTDYLPEEWKDYFDQALAEISVQENPLPSRDRRLPPRRR